jgi:hypothetical protein
MQRVLLRHLVDGFSNAKSPDIEERKFRFCVSQNIGAGKINFFV